MKAKATPAKRDDSDRFVENREHLVLPAHSWSVMTKYQFRLVFLDRLELRTDGAALEQLNALGADGWHIVHIKEDPQNARDLAVFLERELP